MNFAEYTKKYIECYNMVMDMTKKLPILFILVPIY